jgi:BirA family biotin operon repressor/biotin-[acetyl-CoA-carboxylase] ligase
MITYNGLSTRLKGAGVNLVVLDSVDSTNNYAVSIAKETNTATAVVALEQTMGRGTKGRSFFGKSGEGLYFSLLLYPKASPKMLSLATPAAAVAVVRALREVAKLDTKIKWVNDIVVEDKKLCGILSESKLQQDADGPAYLVIGIGINTDIKQFPQELAGSAVSLHQYRADVDIEQLCAQIILNLQDLVAALPDRSFMREYRASSSVLGRYVYFDLGGAKTMGKAIEINDEGNLVVEIEDKRYIVTAGDVSLRFS